MHSVRRKKYIIYFSGGVLERSHGSLISQMHSATAAAEKNFSNAKGAEDLFRQFLANALECVGEQQQ